MKNLDVNRLTLGEIATIEDLSGQAIGVMGNDDAPKGKLLAALTMIAERRNGKPTFKFGDALALSIEEAHAILGIEDDEEGAGDDDATEDVPDTDDTTAAGLELEERPTSAQAAPRPKRN